MSVLIKNMEIPKSCSACPLNYDQMMCIVTGTEWWSDKMMLMDFDSDKERLYDCPLVEIPTPHGDLVDKDKLMKEFMDSDLDHLQRDDWKEVIQIVSDAPTITPEPHWIPVTERLPNRNELVLATYKTTSKIHLCKYLDDGSENSWWSYIDDCCAWNNVILAWMPLPKHYKGVTE